MMLDADSRARERVKAIHSIRVLKPGGQTAAVSGTLSFVSPAGEQSVLPLVLYETSGASHAPVILIGREKKKRNPNVSKLQSLRTKF